MRVKIFSFLTFFILSFNLLSQDNGDALLYRLDKKIRVSFINPGIEFEFPGAQMSTLNFQIGIGYGGSYPALTTGFKSGVQALISPFLDSQYRYYYSRRKRLEKGKFIRNNSGPFFMFRGLVRGGTIASTFNRTTNSDFAIGVGWGYQNYKNRLGWAISLAPYYYFDGKGNSGFIPLFPEITIGYILD